MWRLPVFCEPITSGEKEGGKGGRGPHGSYGRDWKRATSTEGIKTPFLLQLVEESLAQYTHSMIPLFSTEAGFRTLREAPSEASTAGMGRGLTISQNQVLRIIDKVERLCWGAHVQS